MGNCNRKDPTKICTRCNGPTTFKEDLICTKATRYEEFHAYCPSCEAYFSNACKPEDRVIVWDRLEKNVYPADAASMSRLRDAIIPNGMNVSNRKKKEFTMCSENSEDALTWSVFNALEEHDQHRKTYSYFTNEGSADSCQVYYWGHNDRHVNSELISEYLIALQDAGEPGWPGGYSEPDILLFNPKQGLINIEVKYKSPNNDALRKRNANRDRRAQRMLEIGGQYVQEKEAMNWKWYELLRMWVPGCILAERMNMKSFTLVNLITQENLDKEKGCVGDDIVKCLKLDEGHRFLQVTWEAFAQEIREWQAISKKGFWDYLQRKSIEAPLY